jgi:dynactin complex subunit
VDVGNRVIVTGGLEGTVMTIFHWFTEERRANKPVMVGILLDKKKGNCDGVYKGVRHFYCDSLRGVFVENFEIRPATNRTGGGEGGLSRANSVSFNYFSSL